MSGLTFEEFLRGAHPEVNLAPWQIELANRLASGERVQFVYARRNGVATAKRIIGEYVEAIGDEVIAPGVWKLPRTRQENA